MVSPLMLGLPSRCAALEIFAFAQLEAILEYRDYAGMPSFGLKFKQFPAVLYTRFIILQEHTANCSNHFESCLK